jgi:cobalt-zinc-cadmium efflux system outer membrane protein
VAVLRGVFIWGMVLGSAAAQNTAQSQAESTEGHKLTLSEAIAEGLSKSPAVRVGAEGVEQARADLRTASLYPNPQLTAGTTLQPLGQTLSSTNPGGPPQYNFDLAAPLDPLLFGKRSAAKASAQHTVESASADFDDLRRQIRGQVAAAFFDVLEARALLALSREDVDALRNIETLTRRRVELGGAPPIDLDRARLAVISAAQDLRTAETTATAALARLAALLGRTAAEPRFDVAGSLDVLASVPPPDLETAFAKADQVRPDVNSLRRQTEHWKAEAHFQSRVAWPTLQAQVGYVYQKQEALGAPNQDLWEASLNLSLPVFDRNQGNVAKAESQGRQAVANLELARANLRAELAQNHALLSAAQAAVVADDPDQLGAAGSVRERMEAAYKAGGRTILEVLDAQRAYRDARRLDIHIHSSYWHALYAFNASVGEDIVEGKGAVQ